MPDALVLEARRLHAAGDADGKGSPFSGGKLRSAAEPQSKMKVLTVIGARPQFIKAWPVSSALAEVGIEECLLHTGQHYDHAMSGVFFEELGMRKPAINLEVGSGSHGAQTAKMIEGIEQALLSEKPDLVLLYGDTNSTLAGALAAVKLHIPIAHVEAGLRSFNRRMPEEHNRILTDHCSDLLFCPTETAVKNLSHEGILKGVHLVGDVMQSAVEKAKPIAVSRSGIFSSMGLDDGGYILATMHRAENVDSPKKLKSILCGLGSIPLPVVFPLHPRTKGKIKSSGLILSGNIRALEPLGYMDMIRLILGAKAVFTDSGGLQKEAVWLGASCITLREETEWVETLREGENELVGSDFQKIIEAFQKIENTNHSNSHKKILTFSNSANLIAKLLVSFER